MKQLKPRSRSAATRSPLILQFFGMNQRVNSHYRPLEELFLTEQQIQFRITE